VTDDGEYANYAIVAEEYVGVVYLIEVGLNKRKEDIPTT